jgi:hypothetical protein
MGDGGSESVVGLVRSSSEGRRCTLSFPPSDLDLTLLTPSVISSVARECAQSYLKVNLAETFPR